LVFKYKVKEIPESDFVTAKQESKPSSLRKVAGRR
jgi:hypothetical protein